ncbi:MAG: dephospho-CoA kinase [Pelagibacterales bacterium]|nr:dephospho-CoA kinase [Pelagibacterales bacterium]PPR16647.1 MAG: Dephospho-CoA kinase [Alphaproteobacteria bacterium MarineAlpha9_Bin3]|tara:strand:- start:7648 stop:8247 length:600 start_codon:yes stop_codon:yes gene_type:complete
MIVIGLTGSIAMGKSATAEIFRSFGVPVFDADSCVHDLIGFNGKLVPIIAKEFPSTFEKKRNVRYINRIKLGNIIFKNDNLKKKLEKIIHPEIGKERKRWKDLAIRQRHKIICYDVPLLYETNGERACDGVVVVSAPLFIQRQRALKRKNMNLQKLNKILKTQMPDEHKRKRADFIVNTGNGLRFSRNQVKKIIKTLTQ